MIWNFILQKLSAKINAVLLVITETHGSCPGKVGFKMVAAADGSICGTLGGGNMEFNMVELARKLLINNDVIPVVEHQVHKHNDPNSSGMICSGEQDILLFPLTQSHVEVVKSIANSIENDKRCLLAMDLNGLYHYQNPDDKHLFHESEKWIYSEVLGIKETVYIFGAGHISVPLSQILSMLDFRVMVFDNRQGLTTFEANQYANTKQIIDYNDAAKFVTEGCNSYVAIMTFGHSFDLVVLRQFLRKDLKYLGMIGSKSKVSEIFSSLVDEGFSRQQVDRVCSPIGISIGGSSAAEIAVSIAAQIVQYRYQHKNE